MAETEERCPELNKFDLRLCDYTVSVVRIYRRAPEFDDEIAPVLRRSRLYDLIRDDDYSDALLTARLTDGELGELTRVFEHPPTGTEWMWEPYEPLYRKHWDTVPEVRLLATPRMLQDWTDACGRYSDRLKRDDLPLAEGLETMREWIRLLRELVRACGEQPRRSPPEPTEPPLDPQKMSRIEAMVQSLLEQRSVKDWYSTSEIAELLGKAEFTVREWCRLGRIRAEKWVGGRGAHSSWVVSHDELLRYHREGLLPPNVPQ